MKTGFAPTFATVRAVATNELTGNNTSSPFLILKYNKENVNPSEPLPRPTEYFVPKI